ncbi:MAG TPA: hypothetical protein VKR06_20950 [Ktedonosporobacter sp.]|nr:hypothetical protein [Ktedonosporobacter sp.]
MDKLIRSIPDEDAEVLQQQAKASGLNLESYMRLKLIEIAKQIRERQEREEEQAWEALIKSPRGQRTLQKLLAKAREQIAAGETVEGGFGDDEKQTHEEYNNII